ncbi:MAG: hypothetical protein O3C57_01260 [Verrucomicrobia bacterium]|nr:hypothetical protein [Verrucomicrobiota bacterium]
MMNSRAFRFWSLILGFALIGQASVAQTVSGKPTIGVHSVEVTEGLTKTADSLGQEKVLSLRRVADSLGQQLIDRIHNTRKFTVVSRSDLNTILKDQDLQRVLTDPSDVNIAQAFKIAGCKYALIVTMDDFQDVHERLQFEGQQALAHKRTVRMSAVGKIYDTTSGKLLESANFQMSDKEGTKIQMGARRDSARADELLTGMSRDMAHQIANRVSDVIFPAKIIAKTGKIVTVNRGDGTGIERGQVWTAYAVGEALVDPDTKELLGAEEIPVGKVKVVNVTPKFSQAEIVEDYGVDNLQILRLSDQAKSEEE